MHILLIHQAFAALDEPGGTRHHELARYLAEDGHKVTVIASPVSYLTGKIGKRSGYHEESWTPSESGGGVRIIRTNVYTGMHRSFFHRVIAFISFMVSSFLAGLRVSQIDLVWGTSPPIFQGVTAWLLARLKGKPFLFEVRDLWPAFAVQVGVLRQPCLIRLSEWLEKFLYRRADRVIVNSPGFIEHVRQRGARQVDLVPNGSDTRMFNPGVSGQEFRQQYNLEGKLVVLYAGAHGISNDLGVLLEAAENLRQQDDIIIVLLGDGKEKAALQARARDEKLDNVVFIEPIPKAAMPAALAAADICVAILKPVPLYATVYPNKVFDYMAAGKPVVLVIDGVIRQLLDEAKAGISVRPGDSQGLAEAIRRLASDSKKREQLGANGRAYVQAHFDRQGLAAQLEALILAMLCGDETKQAD